MSIILEKPSYIIEHTDSGIYFVKLRGDFSVDTIQQYRTDAIPHMERLAPLLHLTDISDLGEAPLSARWALGKHVKSQAHLIKRSAIFGVTPTMRLVLGAVLRASGRDNVSVARDRGEAERYLLS